MSIFESQMGSDNRKLKFFFCDTTLRDGEQVEGIRYTPEQKVEIAKLLADVGVESIDAGFAATSQEERCSIKRITDLGLNMRIMSMCRARSDDIDYALGCRVNGVILFIPGSDIHLKAKFEATDIRETRKKLTARAIDAIKYAKDNNLFVEFGIEDSIRTDFGFLLEIFNLAVENGADILGTTDTIGHLTPERTYSFIKELVNNFSVPVGIHCHNDLGLATANTIAGLLAGAGYCSPTTCGIGERAGNASLEEVIMILNVLYDQNLKYNTHKIGQLCQIVQEYANVKVDKFKPIVGTNAFSHESGIHTHGMLKNVNTYELFNPDLVGGTRKYALGKHVGKHMVQHILNKNGININSNEVVEYWQFMKLKETIGTYYSEADIINGYKEYSKLNHCDSNIKC